MIHPARYALRQPLATVQKRADPTDRRRGISRPLRVGFLRLRHVEWGTAGRDKGAGGGVAGPALLWAGTSASTPGCRGRATIPARRNSRSQGYSSSTSFKGLSAYIGGCTGRRPCRSSINGVNLPALQGGAIGSMTNDTGIASGGGTDRPVRLNLLGGFRLDVNGQAVFGLPLKARALLAYLAVSRGRPVTRDKIAELLWPGQDADRARNSLRQLLYTFYRTCPGELRVLIDRDGELSIDLDLVDCDAVSLLSGDVDGEVEKLRAVAAQYDGPLLDGLRTVSEDFDDWLAVMRSALEARVLTLCAGLVEAAMTSRHYADAVTAAEQMVAIDPLREDSHRLLMRALGAAGRRSDAIRHFARLRDLLRRELDVEPAPETRAVVDGLSQADVPDRPVPAARVADNRRPMIAVLPFDQFGEKVLAKHLSDGLVADVISQLSGLRDLSVISHGSTMDLPGDARPLELSRNLGARYVVRGGVRRAHDEIRLTTELVDGESGAVVGSFIATVSDRFSFTDQDRIVAHTVNTLAPRVQDLELQRIRGRRPNSLSAYEKTLLARSLMTSSDEIEYAEAKSLIDDVIALEPSYAEAYALAADWHGVLIAEGRGETERESGIAEVERLARTALRLDGNNIRALVFYGHRRSLFHRDYAGAKDLFRRALEVAPHSTDALRWSSLTYSFVGEAEEAVRRASKALELSPRDRDAHSFLLALCLAHYTAGAFETAADFGLRAMATPPVLPSTGGWTAASLVAAGREREARDVARLTMEMSPQRRVRTIVARHPYAEAERRAAYGRHLLAAGFPE